MLKSWGHNPWSCWNKWLVILRWLCSVPQGQGPGHCVRLWPWIPGVCLASPCAGVKQASLRSLKTKSIQQLNKTQWGEDGKQRSKMTLVHRTVGGEAILGRSLSESCFFYVPLWSSTRPHLHWSRPRVTWSPVWATEILTPGCLKGLYFLFT